MKIKRDKRDALFSELVRERAGWVCERCGKQPERRLLQCAHIFGRRHRSTRWHPANAVCLCFGCHRYFTENPIEFAAWCRNRGRYASAEVERMRRLSQVVAAFKKHDLAGIQADLKTALVLMKRFRARAVAGRIEFLAPQTIAALDVRLRHE